MRRAVCLDRDGTVIDDVGYPRDPGQVRLLPGAAEALCVLQRSGFMLVVVSNQSGIGRGLVSRDEAHRVHAQFVAELAAHGVRLDGAYYCPHAPEATCACRKPEPGLLLQAADELGLDLARSVVVGDKPSDIAAGKRAGCRTVLFGGNFQPEDSSSTPDAVANDWPSAVRWILSEGVVSA
jgi:D-glycero-D-manno-heptose 1,7-bisphosphate phosphatase